MSTDTKTVPTFEDLKGKLSPELKIVHERLRNQLIRDIITFAKAKLDVEAYDQKILDTVPVVRAAIANQREVLTHLLKAIKEIDAAKKIADADGCTILDNFKVSGARAQLAKAAKDAELTKDHLLRGMIIRDRRNWKDRKADKRYELAKARKGNTKHEFIRALNTRLDDFVAPDGKNSKVGRDELINKVLDVVFKERLAKTTIERIRNRKA